MARRKKKSGDGGGAAWLVTFSDLMTLLLTFFVLLLSMASMDITTITRISAHSRSLSPLPHSGPAKLQDRLQVIVTIVKDPENILNKKDRLKDLLFPHDILPKEMSTSDLEKNLSILQHPEGVVIVLTDGLLFTEASSTLNAVGKKLLDQLTPVIHAVTSDVNISGHADSTEGKEHMAVAYELSYLRATAVLEHFLQSQLRPDRFSVSGYGPDKPMHPNDTAENRTRNRRVEILIKTTPRIGKYI